MTVKYRWRLGPTLTGSSGVIINGAEQSTPTQHSMRVVSATQQIMTQGNPISLLREGSTRDIGSAFLNQKVTAFVGSDRIRLIEPPSNSIRRWAEGTPFPVQWMADDFGRTWSQEQLATLCPSPIGLLEVNSKGATAIARCRPASPLVEGATAIAELTAGLPAIPGRTGTASGEFLNYQFGVAPTASDLSGLRKSAQTAEEKLSQLERDSGKLIRRRYDYEAESTREVVGTSNGQFLWLAGGVPTSVYLQQGGKLTHEKLTSKRAWFSGAFTYHLPPKGEWRRKIAELDYLYGVKPGIDTAWNLVPFSWLADWQSNMGDVASNIDAFAQDGLVMKYGYLMCEQTIVHRVTLENVVCLDGVWQPLKTTAEIVATTQQRSGANPFGFGVDPTSLTGRQTAILAALGFALR
jgi:hypothetical protein